jgi:molecular chaperone GrpE
MNGVDEPGRQGAAWGPEAEGGPGPRPARGAEGAELGSDYLPEDDDEVVEAEVMEDGSGSEDEVEETAAGLDPLATALVQRDEYLDSLRRLQAEFENYKKRVTKQQADQVARAAVSLVDKLLPVLDTLDLATEHLGDPGSADGRALIAVASQLHDVLNKEGLERLDPVGEAFDPNDHQAVGQLPAEESATPGGDGSAGGEPVVGQVMRAGYRWRGTVVRPAMVMVRG